MVGIFDSGMGGAFALFEYRRLCPGAPVCFFADRENLPYGEKSESELTALAVRDMDILFEMGAHRVLMACCTASTVHSLLPGEYRERAVPIIEPAARAALRASKNGRIGVISTKATQKSGSFIRAVKEIKNDAEVLNIAAPELVELAERGERDGGLTSGGILTIKRTLSRFSGSGIDTLILGCTHFAYFEREIQNITGLHVINSARVGAELMAGF